MGLTDFAIRQARPYTLGDSDGLSLAISAHGRKSWDFRYYWHATQKRMSLGTYPEVTLREARHLRDQARALLRKGINPRLNRKRKQLAVRLAQEDSFEAIYQQWLTHRRLELQDGRQGTLAQMQRIGQAAAERLRRAVQQDRSLRMVIPVLLGRSGTRSTRLYAVGVILQS